MAQFFRKLSMARVNPPRPGSFKTLDGYDPPKITRLALQNAASIAALMLTTEVLIADFMSDAKAAAAGAGQRAASQIFARG
jgi:hypothetical protein